MSDRRLPGCFKYGCFGCLSVFALGVGFILLLGAIQVTTDQTPKPEQRQTSHDLPRIEDAVFPGTDAPQIADVELPGTSDVPPADAPAAGTLVLDLSMGEFTIQPGPAGEPIKVEADYNANLFELKETFDSADDGSWTYDVRFGGRGGFLGMLFRGGGESHNDVVITIPRGHPIRIVGKVGMGESKIDLGGLWIQEVDLETKMGDHFIEFREPTPFPIERFDVEGSMGSVEIRKLGNASPASVELQHGMGEVLLDLEGTWRNDSTVKVSFSMGECRLWIPDDVRIQVDKASIALGERRIEARDESKLPADAHTITIDASGSMGEMRIEN